MKSTLSLICLLTTSLTFAINVDRIAFGSCAHQDDSQLIWNAINQDAPDVFIMLGDNIYGDTKDPEILKEKYQKLARISGFKTMRNSTELVAVWDDHDYGMNDMGKNYVAKNESRELFLNFFNEPKDSPRWTQEGGIYTSYMWGEEGQRVHLMLIDTRWDRDDLVMVNGEVYAKERIPVNMGPYTINQDPNAHMLAEAQWKWIESEIQKPADLRIIASGIQIFSDYTGWECWRNFPNDYNRLVELLERHRVERTIFISGDTHWAEFTKMERPNSYPIWETTSSGLTQEWEKVSPNKHRFGETTYRANYGLMEIDWIAPSPKITISIKNKDGIVQLQNTIQLSDLTYSNSSNHES